MTTIEEMEEKFNQLQADVERFKMFAQRKNNETRMESKAYGAEILEKVEGLQDQMDMRFDAVEVQLGQMTEAINTLVGLLRTAVKDSMKKDEPETDRE